MKPFAHPVARAVGPAPLLVAVALALGATGCRSAEPVVVSGVTAPVTSQAPFHAGVASVDYTPEPGYPLGGYGGGERREEWPLWMGLGWVGQIAMAAHQSWHEDDPDGRSDMLTASTGVHDPLRARAICLRPSDAPPLALVRIDAIGTTLELQEQVAAGVADLGYAPEAVVVAATHTHCGVGAFMRAPLAKLMGTDNFRPEVEARIVAACVEAIRAAHAEARPAAIRFGRARDRGPDGDTVVASNRRSRRLEEGEIPGDAVDDEVGLLQLVERAAPHAPIALLVNYAVHPTVFGAEQLEFSADVAGGIERAFEARFGAPTLFVNGAEGDVRPRRIVAKDGWPRCLELGEALADLCAGAFDDAPLHPTLRVSAALGDKELGSPRTLVAAGRERFLAGEGGVVGWLTFPITQAITLPVNLLAWTLGLTNARLSLTWNGGLALVLHLGGSIGRTSTQVGVVRLEAGDEDVLLLGIPGEATHDLGLAMRAQAADWGARRTFLLGLSQDHIGYIASRREYRRGGYEAWVTLFGEETADELLEAQRGLLGALGLQPRR